MNIVKMVLSYLSPVQPSYLILFVTSECNARCSFCFYGEEVRSAKRKADELTTAEFEKISKKCGNIPYLLVSGGEPVLREDLFEIISFFVKNAGAQFITVPSNGMLPDKSLDLFTRLTKEFPACHFRAAFSIDYHDENHDSSRGVKDCLKKVLESTAKIKELKKSRSNLTMDIVTVYLNSPGQDHSAVRSWVAEKIAPDNHELHILRPEWPAVSIEGLDHDKFFSELSSYRSGSSARENRKFSPFFRGLNSLYIKGLRKVMAGEVLAACTAGKKFTVISETGQVRLCECRNDILGDLRKSDYDLRSILAESKHFLDSINSTNCTCTWECAVSCNIVCNPRFIPSLLSASIKQLFITKRAAQ